MDGPDPTRIESASIGNTWDPWGDMDDDGDVDAADQTAYGAKDDNWPPLASPTVKQAFSDVDNPFMFQGRPHFAFDTEASATEGVLMLNDHRARMNDPVTGRWITRDPLTYSAQLSPARPDFSHGQHATLRVFESLGSAPFTRLDPNGTTIIILEGNRGVGKQHSGITQLRSLANAIRSVTPAHIRKEERIIEIPGPPNIFGSSGISGVT